MLREVWLKGNDSPNWMAGGMEVKTGVLCEQSLQDWRLHWWSRGWDSVLSLPPSGFNPWLGSSDPTSHVSWQEKKVYVSVELERCLCVVMRLEN